MYQPPSQWGDPGERVQVCDLGDDDPLVDDPGKSRPRPRTGQADATDRLALRLLLGTFGILAVVFAVYLMDVFAHHH